MKKYEKPRLVIEEVYSTKNYCQLSNGGQVQTFVNDGKGNYEDFSEFK